MNEKKVIEKILNLHHNEDNTISTLTISIRGARELTERNVETGEKLPKINIESLKKQINNITYASNKLMGIASYLIIVDLIGKIFVKKGEKEENDSFIQALKHFSNLNKSERESLKNLRNSVAHKFSLGNESEVFELDYSENATQIIQKAIERYPSQERKKKKEKKNTTTIFFHNTCNLVDDIYKELKKLNTTDCLGIAKKYKIGNDIKVYDFNPMYFIK